MEIDVTFQIGIYVGASLRKILVQHYYSSDQVDRFRVHGRAGILVLQRQKGVPKTRGWKILDGKVDYTQLQKASAAIMNIQDSIEDYLKVRDPNFKLGTYTMPTGRFNQSIISKNSDNGRDPGQNK